MAISIYILYIVVYVRGKDHTRFQKKPPGPFLLIIECDFHTDLPKCGYYRTSLLAVAAKFSDWSDWSECNSTCGGGIRRRERTCEESTSGATSCRGESEERNDCNQLPCPGACCPCARAPRTNVHVTRARARACARHTFNVSFSISKINLNST